MVLGVDREMRQPGNLRRCERRRSSVGASYWQRLRIQRGCDSQHKRDDRQVQSASAKSHRSQLLDRGRTLVSLQRDFCGFDDYFDGVSLLEPHGFGAAPRDHAFYEVVTHLDHNVGHYSAELIAPRRLREVDCELRVLCRKLIPTSHFALGYRMTLSKG